MQARTCLSARRRSCDSPGSRMERHRRGREGQRRSHAPSTYGIRPGERLSSILERAGGYTGQAYPYGAYSCAAKFERWKPGIIGTHQSNESGKSSTQGLPDGTTDERTTNSTRSLKPIPRSPSFPESSHRPRRNSHPVRYQADGRTRRPTWPCAMATSLMIPRKQRRNCERSGIQPHPISAQSGRSAKWYLSQAGGLTPMPTKRLCSSSVPTAQSYRRKNNGVAFSPVIRERHVAPGDSIVVLKRRLRLAARTGPRLCRTAQVASSVALAVAYIHP